MKLGSMGFKDRLRLLLFKYWAKPLFVVLTGLSLAIGPLSGIGVSTPVDIVLIEITTLADGFLLAMLYLTSIGAKFEKNL